MGHPTIKQAALGRQPLPHSLSSLSGNGIFQPISPGSHLRVPGFDSQPSPVIMWLPVKEGSRRNWLLCLAPFQEVFLLGGTKVRAGWEAFPNSSPRTCTQAWLGDTQYPPHHPSCEAAILGARSPEHWCRGCAVPSAHVLVGKGLVCSCPVKSNISKSSCFHTEGKRGRWVGAPAKGASSKGWGAESTFPSSFCNHLRISAGFSPAQELPSPKSHCCENRAGTELTLKLAAGMGGIPRPRNTASPEASTGKKGHAWGSRNDVSPKNLPTDLQAASVLVT